MELSERDREEVIKLVQMGKPLPARYRASLFEDSPESELIWPGKSLEVERVALPFQSIEQIDEPRSEQASQIDLFSIDLSTGRQSGGWTNKLIWGDNKLILSSLANGPIRSQIEEAGGLKLVYIDPPFDVGADFSLEVEIGEENITKAPTIVEEVAYRDTWGRGMDSYAQMMMERVRLIHSLLANDGILLVHCDWRTSGTLRLIGDEVFGSTAYRNEIIWSYRTGGAGRGTTLPRKHDTIHVWSKSPDRRINSLSERQYLDKPFMGSKVDSQGRHYVDTIMRDVLEGVINVVEDDGQVTEISVRPVLNLSSERVGYPTQKPEGLLRILLRVFGEPEGLVGDFFCGSGTTLSVAEQMGFRWIGGDLGRFAVHTSRKRLIEVQRNLASKGAPYRAFEILNLGSYERQYFAGIDTQLPEEARAAASLAKQEQYLELILSAYQAKRTHQMPEFHGIKDSAYVFVGPLDAPVTQRDVTKVVAAAKKHGLTRVDVIGFEFEMGIKPAMMDQARDEGVTLTLRHIPNEVFDRRAVQKGQVNFYDVGYLDAKATQKADGTVSVAITNFAVFYAQEDADAAASGLRPGGSRVVVDAGQVVRVSKDKKGLIKREHLTKQWSDWIDYWAVDFDFESQKEVISQEIDGEIRTSWTGRFIFENQWQDFRGKGKRQLELQSAPHTYASPGEYKVAIKVIDVFGNDTTKVIKVKVK